MSPEFRHWMLCFSQSAQASDLALELQANPLQTFKMDENTPIPHHCTTFDLNTENFHRREQFQHSTASAPFDVHFYNDTPTTLPDPPKMAANINEMRTEEPLDPPSPTKNSDPEKQEDEQPLTENVSAFKSLGWLDRFLALWILLAIIIGILLGNFVPSTGPVLQKGKFVGVSAPIGKLHRSTILRVLRLC